MTKKNNKKTKVALLLAVIALIGTIGYGVYSKYYTEGEYSGDKTIYFSDFNPTVDGTYVYGSYNYINVTCESNGSEVSDYTTVDSFECYKEITIKNDGDNTVTFEIRGERAGDDSSNLYNLTNSSGDLYIKEKNSNESPSSSYEVTLSSGQSKTLKLYQVFARERDFSTTNYNGTTYDVTDYDIEGGNITSTISYKIIAYES